MRSLSASVNAGNEGRLDRTHETHNRQRSQRELLARASTSSTQVIASFSARSPRAGAATRALSTAARRPPGAPSLVKTSCRGSEPDDPSSTEIGTGGRRGSGRQPKRARGLNEKTAILQAPGVGAAADAVHVRGIVLTESNKIRRDEYGARR